MAIDMISDSPRERRPAIPHHDRFELPPACAAAPESGLPRTDSLLQRAVHTTGKRCRIFTILAACTIGILETFSGPYPASTNISPFMEFSLNIDAVVIDSDATALNSLCSHLSECKQALTICGTALSGTEAIEILNRRRPTVAFFDVRLGDMDAFEVLRTVSCNPLLVFTTAGELYAVKAFDLGAVDYLLKPVDPERLSVTLDRIAANTTSQRNESIPCRQSHQENTSPLLCLSSRIGKDHYRLLFRLFPGEPRFALLFQIPTDIDFAILFSVFVPSKL